MNELVKKLIKKSFVLAGWQIQRTGEPVEKLEFEDGNVAVPKSGRSHSSNSCCPSDSTPAAR